MKINSITAKVTWYPIYGTEKSYAEIKQNDLRTDTFKVYGTKQHGRWLNPTVHWMVAEFDKRRRKEHWDRIQWIVSKEVIDLEIEDSA